MKFRGFGTFAVAIVVDTPSTELKTRSSNSAFYGFVVRYNVKSPIVGEFLVKMQTSIQNRILLSSMVSSFFLFSFSCDSHRKLEEELHAGKSWLRWKVSVCVFTSVMHINVWPFVTIRNNNGAKLSV